MYIIMNVLHNRDISDYIIFLWLVVDNVAFFLSGPAFQADGLDLYTKILSKSIYVKIFFESALNLFSFDLNLNWRVTSYRQIIKK